MSRTGSLERLAVALGRTRNHWVAGEQRKTTLPWTIALSREAGINCMPIAKELEKGLGWPIYDHELLEMIAKEMGLRTSLLEGVDERRGSWFRECLETFMEMPGVCHGSYIHHLIETILSLGAHGECVIIGRGSPQILPLESTLRIRLTAPLKDRIAMASKDRNLSLDQAAKWVDKTDRERHQFVQEHFAKDPCDPSGYDLNINANRFSAGECSDLIIETLKKLKAREDQPR